jgi:hypothetical protein
MHRVSFALVMFAFLSVAIAVSPDGNLLNTTATFVWGQGGNFGTQGFRPITARSLDFPGMICLDSVGNGSCYVPVVFPCF